MAERVDDIQMIVLFHTLGVVSPTIYYASLLYIFFFFRNNAVIIIVEFGCFLLGFMHFDLNNDEIGMLS